jgi:hypothetical protein
LIACGGGGGGEVWPHHEITDPGRGVENRWNLDDLQPISYAALGSGKGRRAGSVINWEGQQVVPVTYEDPSLPVELMAFRARTGWDRLPEEFHRLGTLEGGLTRYPTLMVPKKVRVGMKWQVRANGGDAITSRFEVFSRRVVQGPHGDGAAWQIRESAAGRTIDRLYLEKWEFLGTGTLADIDELLRHESWKIDRDGLPSEAPLLSLTGMGVPLVAGGGPMRLTHGASFQLEEEGPTSLYLAGICDDVSCGLCLSFDPDGRLEIGDGLGCPGQHAGRVAVVAGEEGPQFAVAADAEVVFHDQEGRPWGLHQGELGMEAEPLQSGDRRRLAGGWDPLRRTDLDHGVRWSVGSTVHLAGRANLAISEVGEDAVGQPALVGSFDGTLHVSVGPLGHGALHVSPEGTISRLEAVGGKYHLADLGTVRLPPGHRLAGAWPLAAEKVGGRHDP